MKLLFSFFCFLYQCARLTTRKDGRSGRLFQCHNPPKVAPFLTPWTVVWLVGNKVVRIQSELFPAICVANGDSDSHLRAESSATNV